MKLLLRQFIATLYALCARRRTYFGFAVFVFLDLIVLGMLQDDHLREAARRFYLKNRAYSAPENVSGLTVSLFVHRVSLEWLALLFLALVGGDVVGKEVEDGTMRMTLCRPVSRLRVLTLRWVACAFYTLVFALFIAAAALICGSINLGTGNLLVTFPESGRVVSYAWWPGLARYAFAIPFQAVGLLSIASLAFLFSSCKMKPLAATVAALSLLYADRFFYDMPFFKVFRPFFLTTRLDAWLRIYEPEIPWRELCTQSAALLVIDLLLVAIAWRIFARRDLKP